MNTGSTVLYIKRDKLVHFDFEKIGSSKSRDFLNHRYIFGVILKFLW